MLSWVEEDPKEILQSVYECMERTCEKLTQLNIDISNIKGMWAWGSRCHLSTIFIHFKALKPLLFKFVQLLEWPIKERPRLFGTKRRGSLSTMQSVQSDISVRLVWCVSYRPDISIEISTDFLMPPDIWYSIYSLFKSCFFEFIELFV